jgi:hypothetical protein
MTSWGWKRRSNATEFCPRTALQSAPRPKRDGFWRFAVGANRLFAKTERKAE